jgi:hypothetical protein
MQLPSNRRNDFITFATVSAFFSVTVIEYQPGEFYGKRKKKRRPQYKKEIANKFFQPSTRVMKRCTSLHR